MKTIIIPISAALIFLCTVTSFAAEKENPLKSMNSNNILATYLETTILGNTAYNQKLFTADFEHFNANNNSKSGKKAYSEFLKANKGLQYNCDINYQILEESGKSCIAKATMKFDTFTRVDHITLCHTNEGWKVNKVVTTYP